MSFKSVTTVKIAGPAGAGIKSSGQLLSHILLNHGFHLHDYSEYPSLVRGGHNTYQVSFSAKPVSAAYRSVDIFFSLQPKHWQAHISEFTENTLVFADEATENSTDFGFNQIPFSQFASELKSSLYLNTACIGVVVYLLSLDKELSLNIIAKTFGSDSPNILAFNLGYNYASETLSDKKILINKPDKLLEDNLIVDGNEAFGWGFIKGGGNFYTAYPMTPATGALHFLAAKQKEYDITVVHPEDEIAAASMVAGAAFTGARAATGTSGGGFALMNETISFCGIAELGTVFYLVSRPGPATGMPTWTSQGDLMHAVYSGHGEFPKVVLAPSDHQESFEYSALALNLAAGYQLPVLVLSDKLLAESSANCPNFSKITLKNSPGSVLSDPDSAFRRYSLQTANGVSALTLPGTAGGSFLANSYEHDEAGFATEDASMAASQAQKRALKLTSILPSLPVAEFIGSDKAEKLIISWGSTKGVILEALKSLPPEKYAYLHIKTVWPINPDLHFLIDPFKDITVIENNFGNPLVTLLKSQFNFNPGRLLNKFDGRPFFPEEIYDYLK